MQLIKLIVYFGWSESLWFTSFYNTFVSSAIFTSKLYNLSLLIFILSFRQFFSFHSSLLAQFHHFIFVVLLWILEDFYEWYNGYCKVPISNRTPTHPTPGVTPKCSGHPCLTIILSMMPSDKRYESKFWACNIYCIWWDSIPIKVCWTTAWIWW